MRARLFHLENRVDQDLMQGFDQPKTDFFGLDIALFEASEQEPSPKAAGEKQAPKAAQAVQTTRVKKEVPDLWTAGFDSSPAEKLGQRWRVDHISSGPTTAAKSCIMILERNGPAST